jgi:hypothetical protein
MPNLTDTQSIILSAAAQRAHYIALPLPETLRGGAAGKVVSAMIAKGYLQEVEANLRQGEPMWRETGDGHGVTLIATEAGLAAIGIEREETDADPAVSSAIGLAQTSAPKPVKIREGTKQATMIAMLKSVDGATITEIATATSWQLHTVRGAMAGPLKKKLGLTITSQEVAGRGRVYRIGV